MERSRSCLPCRPQTAGTTDLAGRLDAACSVTAESRKAEAFAASWLKAHPNDVAFHHSLGNDALYRRDLAAAAARTSSLLEAQPNDVMALNNLAWILGQLKDPKALDYAERATTLAPGNPAILDTLGVLLVETGEASAASTSCSRRWALPRMRPAIV